MKGIVLVSGGLDSVTLAYVLGRQPSLISQTIGYVKDLHLVSFDYGQRHKKEVVYARQCAKDLGVRYSVVDLPITQWLKGSALTDNIEVPEGHYASPNMAITVVPNRNAILLSIAFGIAVVEGSDFVAAAMHSGDHPIYPDCRPDFMIAFDQMEKLATEGYSNPDLRLLTPFVHISKADIVGFGKRVNVPFEKTWSCYKGLDKHCGWCGTCVERKEAFHLAEVKDPTEYEG